MRVGTSGEGRGSRAPFLIVVAGLFASAQACGSASSDASADGGVADASVEAPEADGGSPDGSDADARADASPEAGARFCASLSPAPKFCEDFDDGDLGATWSARTERAGLSRLLLDTGDAKSLPASLRAESTGLASVAQSANASLRKTILASASRIQLAWSAKLPVTTVSSGVVALAGIDVADNRFYTLYLRDEDAAAPAAVLEEVVGAVTTRRSLAKLPVAGVWTRIAVDLDLAAGTATVSYDGDKALDAAPITAGVGTEVTVRIGNVYVKGPIAGFVGNYDDVVLDFQ